MKSRTGIKLCIAMTVVCGLLMASTAFASNLTPASSSSTGTTNKVKHNRVRAHANPAAASTTHLDPCG
ncbi:MAG: hypothetical protein ABUL49_00560 [bacterium]